MIASSAATLIRYRLYIRKPQGIYLISKNTSPFAKTPSGGWRLPRGSDIASANSKDVIEPRQVSLGLSSCLLFCSIFIFLQVSALQPGEEKITTSALG
jgi:hypothetical protein